MSKKRQQSADQRELEDLRLRVDLLSQQVADITQARPKARLALRRLSQNVDLLNTRLAQKAAEVERIRPTEAQLERLNVEVDQLSEQLNNIAAAEERNETGTFGRELAKAITTSMVASMITTLLGRGAPVPEVKAEAPPKPKIAQEEPLRRQEDHYVRQDTTERIQEWAELRNENIITQDEFRAQERMLLANAYDIWVAQHAASTLRTLEKLKNNRAIGEKNHNELKSILLRRESRFHTTDYTQEALSDLELEDTAQRGFRIVNDPFRSTFSIVDVKYYWPIDLTREERERLKQELTREELKLLLHRESKRQRLYATFEPEEVLRAGREHGVDLWSEWTPEEIILAAEGFELNAPSVPPQNRETPHPERVDDLGDE